MNLSLDSLREAVRIREEIEELENRVRGLFSGSSYSSKTPSSGTSLHSVASTVGKKRTMSVAARARIAAAQRARWAKSKGSSARATSTAPTSKRTAATKRRISAAGRKRLSEMMKARWAAKRQAR